MNPSAIDANASGVVASPWPVRLPQLRGYALAALSIGVAVGILLLFDYFDWRSPSGMVLVTAVALNAWYGERGPALLALVPALLCMDYFFVEPRYSFTIASSDIAYYVSFLLLAALIWRFSAVRRRVQEDLRSARDSLRIEVDERSSLLDLTHDSISVCDLDLIATYWNRGAEEFYGWTKKDAIAKPLHELLHTVFPDSLDEIRAELLKTDRWHGELRRRKRDGTEVVVASRWSLRRDESGRPLAILETSNDITEEKRRETEIQALNRQRMAQARLLDQTHDSIMFRDVNGVITYWNRGAQELYGWTAEQAIGAVSHQLLRTIFPAPVADIDAELVQNGVWEGELKHIRAGGDEVIVASRWSLGQDVRGHPVVMETNNDITTRKRWEQQIQSLNEELAKRSHALETSNKELEAFAYSISHDLRAPLRHMSGFAELLRKNAAATLDDKSRRYLGMILEAAHRMGSLIDDLLAFSRISRAETQKSLVDLGPVVQEVVAEVRQDTKERDIRWKLDPLPQCYGDRSMLRMALVNLISNAVKFTRTRPQAEIEIGCTGQDRGDAVLFVRDNGVGFDMKYANKLFGVFQRLHPQEAFEGTGIGLAIVQRIVNRHGGRIWAESTLDGGATFYVSLPTITRS